MPELEFMNLQEQRLMYLVLVSACYGRADSRQGHYSGNLRVMVRKRYLSGTHYGINQKDGYFPTLYFPFTLDGRGVQIKYDAPATAEDVTPLYGTQKRRIWQCSPFACTSPRERQRLENILAKLNSSVLEKILQGSRRIEPGGRSSRATIDTFPAELKRDYGKTQIYHVRGMTVKIYREDLEQKAALPERINIAPALLKKFGLL